MYGFVPDMEQNLLPELLGDTNPRNFHPVSYQHDGNQMIIWKSVWIIMSFGNTEEDLVVA